MFQNFQAIQNFNQPITAPQPQNNNLLAIPSSLGLNFNPQIYDYRVFNDKIEEFINKYNNIIKPSTYKLFNIYEHYNNIVVDFDKLVLAFDELKIEYYDEVMKIFNYIHFIIITSLRYNLIIKLLMIKLFYSLLDSLRNRIKNEVVLYNLDEDMENMIKEELKELFNLFVDDNMIKKYGSDMNKIINKCKCEKCLKNDCFIMNIYQNIKDIKINFEIFEFNNYIDILIIMLMLNKKYKPINQELFKNNVVEIFELLFNYAVGFGGQYYNILEELDEAVDATLESLDFDEEFEEENENEINEFIEHLNGIKEEIEQRKELRQTPEELEDDYLNNVINLLIDSDIAADYDELIEAFKAYKGGVLVYLYRIEY